MRTSRPSRNSSINSRMSPGGISGLLRSPIWLSDLRCPPVRIPTQSLFSEPCVFFYVPITFLSVFNLSKINKLAITEFACNCVIDYWCLMAKSIWFWIDTQVYLNWECLSGWGTLACFLTYSPLLLFPLLRLTIFLILFYQVFFFRVFCSVNLTQFYYLHVFACFAPFVQSPAANGGYFHRGKSWGKVTIFKIFSLRETLIYEFTNTIIWIFKIVTPLFDKIIVTNFMGGGGSSGSGGAPPTNLGGLGGASSPGSSPTKPSHSHSAQASPTNTLRPWRPRARSADESSKKVFWERKHYIWK